MDYRTAYETLSNALWQFDEALGDAHTRLMFTISDIEQKLGQPPKPPIHWPPNDDNEK